MIKNIRPTLTEGGKIKAGYRGDERTSRNGKTFRVPEKLDHFIVTKTTRDDDGDFEPDDTVMEALPKDSWGLVREIPIVVHSDVIDEVFLNSYALYIGGQLGCRGDGETATRWFKDRKWTEPVAIQCTCAYLGAKDGPVCKPHGTLHCSLRLRGQALAGAIFKFRTTSIITIQRIIGSLQQIKAACGTLRGLPLALCLRPVRVTPDGVPASTVYCAHVELRGDDLLAVQRRVLEIAQMRRALETGEYDRDDAAYRALLEPPGGDQESDEERGEVAAEFHPDVPRDNAEAPRDAEVTS